MQNSELRGRIAAAGIKHWEIAAAAKISPATLCIWLRKPLEGERLERVTAAVDAVIKDKGGDKYARKD